MADLLALAMLAVCVWLQMRALAVLIERLDGMLTDWLVRRYAAPEPELMMRVVFEVQGMELTRDVPAGCQTLLVPCWTPGSGVHVLKYTNAHECVPHGDGLAVVFVCEGEADG